jgi:arylsulfatase A-like enzyme
MVENLDANIGRLIETLAEEGLLDHTLTLFTSDNGGLGTSNRFEGVPTSNRPLAEGKGWVYEGGTRVCQIAHWPGRIEPGRVCRTPVTSTDFYPTFLDLAGLPLRPEQHADGVSMVPLLEGVDELGREAIFWHYPHYANQGGRPASSLRAGDWKLIEHFEDNRLELFHLREDEAEERDLAAREPDQTRRLHALLTRWRRGVEALIPRPNPSYRPPLPAEEIDPAEA